MKSLCLIALALVMVVCAEDTYTSENDNLDIDSVVKNETEFQAFINCFVDKAPCDPVPADFKKDMAEAVQQACAKCTPAQKRIFDVFLKALKTKPAEYEVYKQKYDPENKYLSTLEAAVGVTNA